MHSLAPSEGFAPSPLLRAAPFCTCTENMLQKQPRADWPLNVVVSASLCVNQELRNALLGSIEKNSKRMSHKAKKDLKEMTEKTRLWQSGSFALR